MVSEITPAVFRRSLEVSVKYDHFAGKFDSQRVAEITAPYARDNGCIGLCHFCSRISFWTTVFCNVLFKAEKYTPTRSRMYMTWHDVTWNTQVC